MNFKSKNSFQSLDKLEISGKTYHFYNLAKAEKNGLDSFSTGKPTKGRYVTIYKE